MCRYVKIRCALVFDKLKETIRSSCVWYLQAHSAIPFLNRCAGPSEGKEKTTSSSPFCELRCEGKIKRGESMFFITPYQKNVGP